MNDVTVEDVRRVAELANLELTAAEEPRMARDLNAILGYIAELAELDTNGVEPMAQVGDVLGLVGSGQGASGHGASGDGASGYGASLRGDAIRVSIDRRAVMASAPETDGRFFKVPKVIER